MYAIHIIYPFPLEVMFKSECLHDYYNVAADAILTNYFYCNHAESYTAIQMFLLSFSILSLKFVS